MEMEGEEKAGEVEVEVALMSELGPIEYDSRKGVEGVEG